MSVNEEIKSTTPEGKAAVPAKAPEPTYRPFINGTEFMCWTEHNCEQCRKGPAPDIQGPNEQCDIENAFALASICAGKLVDPVIGDEAHAASLAARLKWDGVGSLPRRCFEFEANAPALAQPEKQNQPSTT